MAEYRIYVTAEEARGLHDGTLTVMKWGLGTYAIGDRLIVCETWSAVSPAADGSSVPLVECRIEYRADLPKGCTDYPGHWPAEYACGNDEAPKWKASTSMPTWAARTRLTIKDICQIHPGDWWREVEVERWVTSRGE